VDKRRLNRHLMTYFQTVTKNLTRTILSCMVAVQLQPSPLHSAEQGF
jgi:hypothetical protein